ncbi:hypothetical protein D6D15_05503 [Aureobasidium pullulans]|uniref:PH domain-containing protein n=1 Tax=Aureobasidium pullulans TaxID=5580 RepID=A0A4S9B8A0_AURPU|nr:hypothetical protein D6D15_05503 [Aureobasidium pullulans]
MEDLQIHSRSYIVRWVHVNEGHSIGWSVQPHKKSINFGIFKHPGTKNGLAPGMPTSSSATLEPPPSAHSNDDAASEGKKRRGSVAKHEASTVMEKLHNIGLRCVEWIGNCEADKVRVGTYDVAPGQGGMYGLVFDNTFSKTVSKTATLVLMTHPTNAPPKSRAQLKAQPSTPNLKCSPRIAPSPGASVESLGKELENNTQAAKGQRNSFHKSLAPHDIHTGTLYKRRRKKGQGYARRFFSLDFTSGTLSYYRNSHASALRGAVPLSLVAVGADSKTREFSVDSGAEVWHLRAGNNKDFEEWREVLERASATAVSGPSTPAVFTQGRNPFPGASDAVTSVEWERAEEIVSRISGSRDALRRLAQDTDVKISPSVVAAASPSASSVESFANPFFAESDTASVSAPSERLPFWKRKPSAASNSASPAMFKRKTSGQQLTVPDGSGSPSTSHPTSPVPNYSNKQPITASITMQETHERCLALLRDLDNVVNDFSALLAESKARRMPINPNLLAPAASRMSIDSVSSQEFFDAEDVPSQLLSIRRSSEATREDDDQDFQDVTSNGGDSDTSSDVGDATELSNDTAGAPSETSLFPTKPTPLTSALPKVTYRSTIPPPKQPPPSLIGFLRKNAGKDLSTVSMPVTANEPLSALQRLAEPFESVDLLHKASSLSSPDNSLDRLIYVAAFAISNFASNRVKERAIRKPFNPMLGETYELVRSDLGFRFVSEKVCHRPVRMAFQADALDSAWSLSQSQQPTQKFWGKSAELNTEGKVRLILHNVNGEKYSWTLATCFLRNVIAGEKYVEPVESMTIVNETTSAKAVATFKAGGLFSGRSEEVTTQFYNAASSSPLSATLVGKWTESLQRTDTSETIWTAGPLVPNAPKVFGYTSFAACLNQLDETDKKAMSPTDSRLRPDQRALEDGKTDEAEALKARLEERQRARRKVLESHGVEWKPRFFEIVKGEEGDEEVWRLSTGKNGYWECRDKGEWKDVETVFET